VKAGKGGIGFHLDGADIVIEARHGSEAGHAAGEPIGAEIVECQGGDGHERRLMH